MMHPENPDVKKNAERKMRFLQCKKNH